jgi:NADH:ubiquinone oxidoreductase subunit 2 (subunit N)
MVFALLALSLGTRSGLEIYMASLLPRLVALWLWAFSLALLRQQDSSEFEGIEGYLYRYPFISTALIVSSLSVAGLPLLASFPLREALFVNIGQRSLGVAMWSLLGSVGLIFCSLRAFSVMLKSRELLWVIHESWPKVLLMVSGMVLLLLMGLFPNLFLPETINLLQAFGRLY